MKLLKRQNQSKQQVRRIHRSLFIRAGLAAVLLALLAVMVFTMSVAWYSNVVETQTLTFTAESSMTMEGWITLTDEELKALPGDQGEISFSVKNQDDTRSVTVTALVDKSALEEEEMQQRIYFYVDQSATVNGESVARIYLSSSDSYGWTVLAGQTLELPDEDTPALCWQWVNDVLGYYVRLSEDDQVTEYLRPIEYDYDTAIFDEDGYLESVVSEDGTTTLTLEEFLTQLTETDGYAYEKYEAGYLADENKPGWYCVDPEEGIWFYLCTEKDILEANTYDTKLTFPSTSNSAGEDTWTVQIKLSIVRNTGADYLVTTAPDLLELLSELSASESDTYTYITLDLAQPEDTEDAACETYNQLSAALQVPANVALTIQLNGEDLISTVENGTVLSVASGGALTLTGGGTWTAGDGSVTWTPSGDAVNLGGLSVNYPGGLTIDASKTALILENGTVTIGSGVSGG
ncbi:MAG: hypothetical protein LIO42_01780 [Oscillospiraceae bacterium]|nr:hypothetical protein [Oscillospiraceae bacterium]